MKLNIKSNIDFRYAGVVSAVVLAIGFVISFLLVPLVIKSVVKNMVVLTPGSFMRRHTDNASYTMKYYMFNLTNAEDAAQGAVPKLQELGPYVYDIDKVRQNHVDDEEADTLTYDMFHLYRYRPDLSVAGAANQTMCTFSALLIGGLVKTILETPELISFVQTGLDLIHGSPDTPIVCFNPLEPIHTGFYIKCDQPEFTAKAICSALGAQEYFRKINGSDKHVSFAALFKLNNSVEVTATIMRGKKNLQDVGKYVLADGKPLIDIFDHEKCNEINGTDGVSFPPRQKKENVQWTFFKNLCRSLPWEFASKKRIHGINTLLKEMKWNSPMLDPDCNFNEYRDIHYPGVLDMHECTEGFTYFSAPHNYMADPVFSENIDGMIPDKNKHISAIYLDPLTGVMLRGHIRFQVNMLAQPMPDYPILSKIRDFILPLNWLAFEYEAPPAIIHRLQIIHTGKSIGNFIGRFFFLVGVIGCMLSIAAIALGIGPDTPKILNVVPNKEDKNSEGSASTRADD